MDERAPGLRYQPSLYEVLQVSPRAVPEVIRAAYRVLARDYHPDLNSAPKAAQLMRKLNAAYHVLGDPQRRARYDAECARTRRARLAGRTVRRRGVHSPAAPAAAIGAGHRAASPIVPAAVAVLVVAVALAFLFWIVYDTLDDRSADPSRPRADVPALVTHLARSTDSQPGVNGF